MFDIWQRVNTIQRYLFFCYKGMYRDRTKLLKHQEISRFFNMVFWLQLSREIRLCAALLTVFEENGFLRWSLNSVAIFGTSFFWFFLTIHVRVRQVQSDSFRFLSDFCFSEEVFLSFSKAVITFETALLATSNNSAVFVTLVPVIWAPIISTLLKSYKSAILINFY